MARYTRSDISTLISGPNPAPVLTIIKRTAARGRHEGTGAADDGHYHPKLSLRRLAAPLFFCRPFAALISRSLALSAGVWRMAANVMGMKRRHLLFLFVLIVALFVGGCCQWVWQAKRQYALNRELIVAVMMNNSKQALVLVEAGANPNMQGNEGNTPLGDAAFSGASAIVQILLEHGANANASPYLGITPLMMAANHPYYNPPRTQETLRVLQLLLAHGATVNAQDRKGRTALLDAAYWGEARVVEYLLKNGADPLLKNQQGHTALEMAQGSLRMVQSTTNPVRRTEQLKMVIKLLQKFRVKE